MRQKNTIWILTAVITAALVGLWVWQRVKPHNPVTQTLTVADVRKKLEQALPVGSSRTTVETYLDSQSIPHSYIDDSKFPNERRVELALIRSTSQSLLVRGDIQIRFRFDESGRLADYSVQEVFTGP
jgi:hypothetical protein